jgi:DNA (cytosine-5)-methyltransferase 1
VGHISSAPIWDDIRTFPDIFQPGFIDIIFGGFPCQDISVAGSGQGLAGERSGLFFEIIRLVREIQPPFIFLENVPAIRTRGLDTVLKEFAKARYDCRWTMLSAADVGAPHKRERWFLLARRRPDSAEIHSHPDGEQSPQIKESERSSLVRSEIGGLRENVGHTNSKGLEGGKEQQCEELKAIERSDWWSAEPDVGRVVNGLPHRVDRIRGLGNSVVPKQAKEAFKRLMGL